jgi:hypothetical protein
VARQCWAKAVPARYADDFVAVAWDAGNDLLMFIGEKIGG